MVEPVPLRQAATFEDFYRLYPRKIDKTMARAKWDAITGPGLETRMLDRDSNKFVHVVLRATPEEIMTGLRRYRDNLPLEYDEQFIPFPTTWLNRGRWDD